MINTLPLFDTHAHLFDSAFDPDRQDVIQNAVDSGVGFIVVPATDVSTSRESVALAGMYPQLFAAVGVHPHESAKASKEELLAIADIARERKVVAIGEIGLDYFYDFSPKDIQIGIFRDQLDIAARHDLPAIIHTRDSLEDAISVVKEVAIHNPNWGRAVQPQDEMTHLRGVFHCYTGDLDTALQLRGLGFLVSFPGIVTFKKSHVGKTVIALGFNKFLIETDSPYLTPVPLRGKRNEPRNLTLIVRHLSQMFSVDESLIVNATTANALRLFRISLPQQASKWGNL